MAVERKKLLRKETYRFFVKILFSLQNFLRYKQLESNSLHTQHIVLLFILL